MTETQDYSFNFYSKMLWETRKNFRMFGVFPMISEERGKYIAAYTFLLIATSLLDFFLFPFSPFIFSLLSFLLITEHQRLVVVRKSILELCLVDEVYHLQFSKEIGDTNKMLDWEREDIFWDNFQGCYSIIGRTSYIKKHYDFLLTIAFLQMILTFFLFIQCYTN